MFVSRLVSANYSSTRLEHSTRSLTCRPYSLFNLARYSSGLASSLSLQPSQQIHTCCPLTSAFSGAPMMPSISPVHSWQFSSCRSIAACHTLLGIVLGQYRSVPRTEENRTRNAGRFSFAALPPSVGQAAACENQYVVSQCWRFVLECMFVEAQRRRYANHGSTPAFGSTRSRRRRPWTGSGDDDAAGIRDGLAQHHSLLEIRGWYVSASTAHDAQFQRHVVLGWSRVVVAGHARGCSAFITFGQADLTFPTSSSPVHMRSAQREFLLAVR